MESEFESLGTDDPRVHMIAGACSGILEHVVVYPLDCIKTRLQCIRPDCPTAYQGTISTFKHIFTKEGIRSFYRGVPAVVMGAGPAHAAYFSLYEFSKKTLSEAVNVERDSSPIIHGLSGMTATFAHDSIMNPMEVVKQRMQAGDGRYKGITDCITRIITKEGPTAFYRSLPVQLLMNFPYHSINFITYEFVRRRLIPQDEYNVKTHLSAGALSGGAASALTTPLDVIKTTLNVQDPKLKRSSLMGETLSGNGTCKCEVGENQLKGLRSAVSTVYRLGGASAFFRGLVPRVLFSMPSCSICWTVYETFKFLLSHGNP